MVKLNTNTIKNIVEDRDGTLLKDSIINHRRILTIKCNKDGHIWDLLLFNFQKGKWCAECFKRSNSIYFNDIKKLVESKGYVLLTKGNLTRTSRIKVKCNIHNFIWETCYGNMQYANGNCRLCASGYPDLKIINNFIKNKNGLLIKRSYDKRTDKRNLIVKCIKHDYVWNTRWGDLCRGIWCNKCAIENKIIKYEEIKLLVESKDAILLTENCSYATQKFRVKCLKDDYEWTTTWARINQNCWCPRCSGMERYTLEKVCNIINKKGGKLLDGYINNVKQKISVECSCGNIFLSSLNHIVSHNLWCQLCDLSNSTQKRLFKIIKDLFPEYEVKYNNRSFKWLKTKKSNPKMEIDIWVPEIKLAIEYDGEQHFKPVRFGGMSYEKAIRVCEEIKRRDRKKDKLIAAHKDQVRHFIRFNYKDKIYRENVESVLKKYGVIE